jgi:hypothetical protein
MQSVFDRASSNYDSLQELIFQKSDYTAESYYH